EKTKESDKCGAPKPKFNREGLEIRLDYSGKDKDNRELSNFSTEDRKAKLTAEKVCVNRLFPSDPMSYVRFQLYTIFSRVSDEDCAILGLNPVHARPEWLLVKVLPVPPPHVRPSIEFDASTRSEDDLTHKYAEILKANAALKNDKARSAPPITLEKHLQVLQYHVKPFPVLLFVSDSLFSATAVGVPRSIAANLTVPEMVTRFNIEKLQRLVKRGPGVENHPGAKYIIRDDGTVKDLEFLESVNDAKILDYSTFRMNLTCTPPYNADFDG
ncbi:RpII215, partial [Symbiodinium sp. KB8]